MEKADNRSIAHEETREAEMERLQRTVALLQDHITLLEEENSAFAGMLKERGVEVRARSQIALELPPAILTPLDRNAEIRALMTPAEQKLLDDLCGAASVLLLLKSDTAVDTGNWFRKGRVWVGATAQELALLAYGRKPFFQKTPFLYLRESIYNHVTGEVVLAPAKELKLRRVALPPLDGYQLLAQIYYNHKGEKP